MQTIPFQRVLRPDLELAIGSSIEGLKEGEFAIESFFDDNAKSEVLVCSIGEAETRKRVPNIFPVFASTLPEMELHVARERR